MAIYQPYVRPMSAAYQFYILAACTALVENFKLAFGRTSSVCRPYVSRMSAVYQLSVSRMPAVCQPYIRRMSAGERPYVSRMSAIHDLLIWPLV